jgi:hypothetical protein
MAEKGMQDKNIITVWYLVNRIDMIRLSAFQKMT